MITKELTVEQAKQVFTSSWGSEQRYKRYYCNSMIYTQGVMEIQQRLNAGWLVDLVVSHMPQVLECFNNTEDDFYVVSLLLDSEQRAIFEIYREGYIDNEYNEHISVAYQEISYVDLPCASDEVTEYKLYLELSSIEPVRFTLLQTSEH